MTIMNMIFLDHNSIQQTPLGLLLGSLLYNNNTLQIKRSGFPVVSQASANYAIGPLRVSFLFRVKPSTNVLC